MLRPTAFVRTMVDAATVRPFFTALLEMKQARLRVTRLVEATSAPVEAEALPTISTPRAA